MADLIDPDDPDDPIARQFVPDAAELATTPDERADPIGDDAHAVTEGLIHRYPDRVLLKLVSVCPVYCRFCFRRETVGQAGSGLLSAKALDAALDYIREHREIWEVILSGGDPLIAAPRRLEALGQALAAIDHVKVVRYHTRVPVVAPERVTDELVAALTASGKATWLAIHANHPRELTAAARAALARLADGGLSLVSQTVLLKGVNDDAQTLAALMRGFVEARREALLPPSRRSGARHRPFPNDPCRGQGADEGTARPRLRSLPADLRARHPRRPRQGADRARLSRLRRRRLLGRGLQRRSPRLFRALT